MIEYLKNRFADRALLESLEKIEVEFFEAGDPARLKTIEQRAKKKKAHDPKPGTLKPKSLKSDDPKEMAAELRDHYKEKAIKFGNAMKSFHPLSDEYTALETGHAKAVKNFNKWHEYLNPEDKEDKEAASLDLKKLTRQQKAEDAAAADKEKLELDTNSVSFQSVVRGKIPIMEMKDLVAKAKNKKPQTSGPMGTEEHIATAEQHKKAAEKLLAKADEYHKQANRMIKDPAYGYSHKVTQKWIAKMDAADAEAASLMKSHAAHMAAAKELGESAQPHMEFYGFLGDQYMELAEHFEQKGNSYDANYCYDKAIYFFENGGVSLKK